MTITDYKLILGDNEVNSELHLSYTGNEYIAIRRIYHKEDPDDPNDPKEFVIRVPRSILENFIKMINEC